VAVRRRQETKWRYNTAHDPAADPAYGDFDFYGNPDHRAWIWLRPYEPPPEVPDAEYPFWLNTGRVLEHWHSGSLTRRIPVLHRAVPEAYVEITPRTRASWASATATVVRLVSRRGAIELEARIDYRAQPHARPGLRAVLRRGSAHQRADAGRVLPDLRAAGLQEVRGPRRADRRGPAMTGGGSGAPPPAPDRRHRGFAVGR
jgi:anaerobic selenocysteine-containing dehydrogenase